MLLCIVGFEGAMNEPPPPPPTGVYPSLGFEGVADPAPPTAHRKLDTVYL